VAAVTPVSTVHEEVQQGTGQDEKVGQEAEHMCAVLGHQEECANGEKNGKANSRLGPPEAGRLLVCIVCKMVRVCMMVRAGVARRHHSIWRVGRHGIDPFCSWAVAHRLHQRVLHHAHDDWHDEFISTLALIVVQGFVEGFQRRSYALDVIEMRIQHTLVAIQPVKHGDRRLFHT